MAKPGATRDRPRVGLVVRRSTTSPINLGVAAAGATLAIGLGSLPLAALGALAYAALVAYDTFSPAFWTKVYALPAPAAVVFPAPAQIVDAVLQRATGELLAGKRALDQALRDSPSSVLDALSTTLSSLQALERHAVRLIQRGEDIARHLRASDAGALRADVRALAQRAAATQDATARQRFQDAGAAREDELRTLGELRGAKDQIDAHLLHLTAVLAGLPTKVVHMRALDGQAADQFSGDVNAELAAVASELEMSEQMMKSLGEITR
ncbi:MAG TPA: hypothetical protein VGC42_04405 [Kofleriaceae bacterium]